MIAPHRGSAQVGGPGTGPSSIQGAQVIRLKKANSTVTATARSGTCTPSSPRSCRATGSGAPPASAAGRAAGKRQRAEREYARRVGARVRGYHDGRPGQGEPGPRRARGRRSGSPTSQPVQRVGVTELAPGRDLDGERVLGRGENASPVPPNPASRTNTQSGGRPANSAAGERSLAASGARRRRASPAAAQPVGGGPGDRQHQHLGYDPRREHEPQAGRARPSCRARPR